MAKEELVRCDDCGLPVIECNAWTTASDAFIEYLRSAGYSAEHAKGARSALIPDMRRDYARMKANYK